MLQLFDVREQRVPADDVSLRVPKRETANLEPSIHAIESTDALKDLIGVT